jgi:hypothetical protein
MGRLNLITRLRKIVASLASHLQVKLVLLLLAAVSWFFVHTSQEMEVEFALPLVVDMDLPEHRTLVVPPPAEVRVLLKGRGRNLLVFALFGEGRCVVEGGRGGGSVPLTSQLLELDGAVDLSVLSVFPALLNLDVDRLETRRLPVRLAGRLEASDGYVLTGEPRLEPDHVKVSGPRSVLDTLGQVWTEVVGLENRRRGLELDLSLVAPASQVLVEPATVRLVADVQRRAERRFTGIPLRVRNLPAPLSVRPRSLDLTIVGGEDALAALEKKDIQAVLDGARLDPDVSRAPCRIILPDGFSWTDPDPALFRISGRRERRAEPAPANPDGSTVPPLP